MKRISNFFKKWDFFWIIFMVLIGLLIVTGFIITAIYVIIQYLLFSVIM